MPANGRSCTEFVLQELMTKKHVVIQVFVIRACFIAANPASVGKFNLAVLNEAFHAFLSLLLLPCVPHLEELDLRKSDLALSILQEALHGSREYDFHISGINTHIRS